jgi:hypothetical protein
MLVDAGANLSLSDSDGYLPLHIFASKGLPRCVSIAIRSSPIEAQTHDGETPLLKALGSNQHEVMIMLFENGASLNCNITSKGTLLHYAARYADITSMRLLAQMIRRHAKSDFVKIDVNRKDLQELDVLDQFEVRLAWLLEDSHPPWFHRAYSVRRYRFKRRRLRFRKAFEDLLEAAQPRPIGWTQAYPDGQGESSTSESREDFCSWVDCWSSEEDFDDDEYDEEEDSYDESEEEATPRFHKVENAEDEEENKIEEDREDFHDTEEELKKD